MMDRLRRLAWLGLASLAAGMAHAGAVHHYQEPFPSLLEVEARFGRQGSGPEFAFGPFTVREGEAGGTLEEQPGGVSFSGAIEILVPEPETALLLSVNSTEDEFRFEGFGADGVLLFDEIGAGNRTFFDTPSGKVLLLASEPIARVVITSAAESALLAYVGLLDAKTLEPVIDGAAGRLVLEPQQFVPEEIGGPGTAVRNDSWRPDPANGAIGYLVAADGRLLQSLDAGASWAALARPWSQLDELIIHPTASERLFVLDGDRLWRSADRGASWSDSGLAGIEAIDIVEDNRTQDRFFGEFLFSATSPPAYRAGTPVFVAASGTLLRSDDLGASFEAVGPLPGAASRLYAGDGAVLALQTEDGVLHRSTASGASWEPDPAWLGRTPESIVFSPCGDLAFDGGELYARPNARGFGLPADPLAIRAPAIRVDGPAFDLDRATTYGCEILLPVEDAWWQFTGFADGGSFGICFDVGPSCPPFELVFQPLALASADFPLRRSARLFGWPNFEPRDEYVVLRDGALFDLAPVAGTTALPDVDRYSFRPGRRDFYPVEVDLPPGSAGGAWGLTFFSDLSGGLNVGADLPAGGAVPGFIAFALLVGGPVDVTVFEYTGAIEALELRLLRQDGETRTPVAGPLTVAGGGQLRFDLERGPLYILEVRNGPEDPAGRFGVELLAGSLRNGASFGGWVEEPGLAGFFGVALDTRDTLTVDAYYGKNYGAVGAGQVLPDFGVDDVPPAGPGLARATLDGLNQRVTSDATGAALAPAGDTLVLSDGLLSALGWEGTVVPELTTGTGETVFAFAPSTGIVGLVDYDASPGDVDLQFASRLAFVDLAEGGRAETTLPVAVNGRGGPVSATADDALDIVVVDGYSQLIGETVWRYDRRLDEWTQLAESASGSVAATVARDGSALFVAEADPACDCAVLSERRPDGAVTRSALADFGPDAGRATRVTALSAARSGEVFLGIQRYDGDAPFSVAVASERLYRYDFDTGVLEDLGEGDRPIVSPAGDSLVFERAAIGQPDARTFVGGRQLFWRRLADGVDVAVAPPVSDLAGKAFNGDVLLFVSSDRLIEFDTNGDDAFLWRVPD